MINPGPVCVKKPRPSPVTRRSTSFTNRLVDDPIRVVIPAKIQIKLSGIKYRDAAVRVRPAIAVNTGMNITTTGVLFMNMDTIKATEKTMANVRFGRLTKALLIRKIGPSNAPVWNMPWPTTNKAIIAMRAGAPKPVSSEALSNPSTPEIGNKAKNNKSAVMMPTDILSIENLSRKYKITATATIPIVAHICHVITMSVGIIV